MILQRKTIVGKFAAMILIVVFMMSMIGVPAFALDEPFVGGKSVILLDPHTGKVLFERNADEKNSIASITKIMTILVAMDKIESGANSLSEKATISKTAADLEGSTIYLMPNDRVTLEDLIIATIVRSANDAAYSIAEHMSSDVNVYVALMNEKAKQLGMTNTHFANPDGLEDPENYSTARDITKMAMEFCKNPKLVEWASTPHAVIRNNKVTIENTNNFLKHYPGATGLKTGYTETAGYCLVATATRGNTDLMSVILNVADDHARMNETEALMDWGFNNFKRVHVAEEGQDFGVIKVSNSDVYRVPVYTVTSFDVLVEKSFELGVDLEVVVEKYNVKAPFEVGTVLGAAKLMHSGAELAKVELASQISTKRTNIFVRIWRAIIGIFSKN